MAFKTHNTHIINLQVRKFAAKWPGGDERFFFRRPEINQLITRNLRSYHLHRTNAHGDDIDFITRNEKRVNLHLPQKVCALLMKTSLSNEEGRKRKHEKRYVWQSVCYISMDKSKNRIILFHRITKPSFTFVHHKIKWIVNKSDASNHKHNR